MKYPKKHDTGFSNPELTKSSVEAPPDVVNEISEHRSVTKDKLDITLEVEQKRAKAKALAAADSLIDQEGSIRNDVNEILDNDGWTYVDLKFMSNGHCRLFFKPNEEIEIILFNDSFSFPTGIAKVGKRIKFSEMYYFVVEAYKSYLPKAYGECGLDKNGNQINNPA